MQAAGKRQADNRRHTCACAGGLRLPRPADSGLSAPRARVRQPEPQGQRAGEHREDDPADEHGLEERRACVVVVARCVVGGGFDGLGERLVGIDGGQFVG